MNSLEPIPNMPPVNYGTFDDLLACALDDVRLRTGFGVVALLGRDKHHSLAAARKMLYRRLRAFGLSYPEIGRLVNRTHDTVLRGCRS